MTDELVERIVQKTSGKCGFPGCHETWRDMMEIHHIYPRSVGGGSQYENLVLLCRYHHRLGTESAHKSNDVLILLQRLYAPDRSVCMITKEEIAENKKRKSSINRYLSNKRKEAYKKAKSLQKKEKPDKDILKFRERLRLKPN